MQLQQVAQTLLPRLTADRAGFQIMPMRDVDAHLLEWEQLDNYTGLQQIRGLNGDPSRVKQIGGKRYLMTPGVYGEFGLIDELMLTTRRPWGTLAGSINITDLVMEKQNQLLGRRLDRVEWIIWTLLVTGTFSVANGAETMQTDSYTFQTFTASPLWSTVATATPLADLRTVQLLSRGYSVDFGGRARLYMNRKTFNTILSNTNAADLGGRRVTGLQTVNGPNELNVVLGADDLPQIVIYDQGYLNDAGTFVLYIPDGKAVLVGNRTDGSSIGEYRMTRNANNPNMAPGAYMRVVDEPDQIPRQIEIHDGHNGGPVLWMPSAVVVMTV